MECFPRDYSKDVYECMKCLINLKESEDLSRKRFLSYVEYVYVEVEKVEIELLYGEENERASEMVNRHIQ